MILSVVIPTLNSSALLGRTIESMRGADEIVVVDGGSVDNTPDLARSLGAAVVSSPRGRGIQLARGAAAARGDWLLFLHADTELAPAWRHTVADFTNRLGDGLTAGYFRFTLRSTQPQARLLEHAVAWRSHALGLPYGDQGLLMSRHLYEDVGGYRALPLMEDVDMIRRLGKSRLAEIPVEAVTDAVRWERQGWLRRSARNLLCLSLYYAGLPPQLIQRIYG